MSESESLQAKADSVHEPWWMALYPIWQWCGLLPSMIVVTIIAAILAVVVSLAGYPRAANLHIAARWARMIAWLTPMKVEIQGSEHIDPNQSYVVVANHLSQYDIPLIYGFCGIDLRWVIKAEVLRIPFVAQGCRAIGHIFIDRGNPEQARAAINRAVARLPEGTGLLFFPEGTRSRSGALMSFRKGAFRVAADRDLPILPMTVVGTDKLMPPTSLRIRPGRARLIVDRPIRSDLESAEARARALRRQARDVIASNLAAERAG